MSNADRSRHMDNWTATDTLVTHLREDHGWSIYTTEYDDMDSLKGMHQVAHQHDTEANWPDDAPETDDAPELRTWWITGSATHGMEGLACVSEEWELGGVGSMAPDDEFTGTVAEMVAYLVEQYDDMDTDDEELLEAWGAWCGECKSRQVILNQGGGSGFAGGRVYWADLECGHQLMDESGDVAAAR